MNNKRVETRWKRRHEKRQLRKEVEKEIEEIQIDEKPIQQLCESPQS
jgi:hypothetical protein